MSWLFTYMSGVQHRAVVTFCIAVVILGFNRIEPYNRSPELHVRYFLVASVVLWTLFYHFLGKLYRVVDHPLMDANINGYPVYNWLVGITHGAVILPFFTYKYYVSMPAEWAVPSDTFFLQPGHEPSWKTLWSTLPSTPMLSAAWVRENPVDGVATSAEVLGHRYLEQIGTCVAGFLFKDFAGPLEWAFTIHHVFSIGGCVLCMLFPVYAGAAIINITQCELASAVFDFYNLVPSKFMLWTYVVVMTASNIVALDNIVIILNRTDVVGPVWLLLYLGMGCTIVVLRMAGVVMAVLKGSATSGGQGTMVDGNKTERKKDE